MRALITGVGGQDGSYLAELLLSKNYEVYGLVRRTSTPQKIVKGVKIIEGDLLDQMSLNRAVVESMPDEIYNLAAQSFVGTSWRQPVLTAEVTGLGTLRMLEAMRMHNPKAKFYQASSSEMFGNHHGKANENTPFNPRSPYGVAKLFAHKIAVNYRETYGMRISCGILFNHESPRRGEEFVTQKIAQAAKAKRVVTLGNVEAKRDWGYAPEYVEAMWLMLQHTPDDYVIGTGESHSVKEFAEAAGVQYTIDKSLQRPTEIYDLIADATKARKLGWQPKTTFKELVRIMCES